MSNAYTEWAEEESEVAALLVQVGEIRRHRFYGVVTVTDNSKMYTGMVTATLADGTSQAMLMGDLLK
jgi:hypothetical protein